MDSEWRQDRAKEKMKKLVETQQRTDRTIGRKERKEWEREKERVDWPTLMTINHCIINTEMKISCGESKVGCRTVQINQCFHTTGATLNVANM